MLVEPHRPPEESPQSVVESFIHAMNLWEQEAIHLSRQYRETSEPDAYWPEIRRKLAEIHELFLTPRQRIYASQPTFQNPPAYDPKKESICSVETATDSASVETFRKTVLGGGQYRYLLHEIKGKWLIDSATHLLDGKWKRHIL